MVSRMFVSWNQTAACGVVAHGRYTIAWADQYRRLTVTLLRCVKLSSMPSREYSRPIPLCLKPPYEWPGD